MIKKFERIHFLHFITTNIYEMWIIKKKQFLYRTTIMLILLYSELLHSFSHKKIDLRELINHIIFGVNFVVHNSF